METLDLILRAIGAFTILRWTFKAFYWYFIIDHSGNAERYEHYLDER